MSLGIYDRGFFSLNGSLLGETGSGGIKYEGSPVPVQTMVKDLAGFMPTPKLARLSVESFVPRKGFEVDVISMWLATEIITCDIQFGGGAKMTADGCVDAPSIAFSTTDPTKLTFDVIIEAKPFEAAGAL